MLRTIMKKILNMVCMLIVNIYRYKPNPNKILVIRADALGDFIIFSPLITRYIDLYRDYDVFFLVNSSAVELAQILLPVDHIIKFDRKRSGLNIIYRIKFLISLKKSGFITAIHTTYSRDMTGDLLAKSTCAKTIIGYEGDLSNISKEQKMADDKIYTYLVPNNPKLTKEIERNIHFINSLGDNLRFDLTPHFDLTEERIKLGEYILLKQGYVKDYPYVVIHPGASFFYKRWPVQKFTEIINYLTNDLDYYCVITGTNDEKYISEYFNRNNKKIINTIGKLTVAELLSILKKATFCLSNDTATVHISASVYTPVICIMGGGHFRRFFPYDSNGNRIVYNKNMKCLNDNWECSRGHTDKTAPCVESITVKQVRIEIDNLLKFLIRNNK